MNKIFGQVIFVSSIVCGMIYILFFNWENIEKSFSKPKPIISKVTLKNECTIISEAFIVVHVESKRFTSFSKFIFSSFRITVFLSDWSVSLAIRDLKMRRAWFHRGPL